MPNNFEDEMLNLVSQEQVVTPQAPQYGFEDAWALYPKKQARKDALKAWGQVVTAGEVEMVIVAIYNWRRVWAARADIQYVPLMASWLRGERFHDELPPEFIQRPASQAPVKPQDDTPRGEMPQKVRDAIAKFKKG